MMNVLAEESGSNAPRRAEHSWAMSSVAMSTNFSDTQSELSAHAEMIQQTSVDFENETTKTAVGS